MALMALLGGRKKKRTIIVAVGLFGAALIYGDGAITPAISVLSAFEGLTILTNGFVPYIVPMTVAILVVLFLVQPRGTEKIGKMFGPIMAVWFVTIGLLGLWGIAQNPSVLVALNPAHGVRYLISGGATSFFVLGAVFLCVTGAEALYADMGHFGRRADPAGVVVDCVPLPCPNDRSGKTLTSRPTVCLHTPSPDEPRFHEVREDGVAEQRGRQDEPVGLWERHEAELFANPSIGQGDADGANDNGRRDKGRACPALYEREFSRCG